MIGDINKSQEFQHPNNRSQKEREIREERIKKRGEEGRGKAGKGGEMRERGRRR